MVGRRGGACRLDAWVEEKAWLPTTICWKWLRSWAAAGEGVDGWLVETSVGIKISGDPGLDDVAGSYMEAGDMISPAEDFGALGVAGEGKEDEEGEGGVVIHPSRLFEVGVVADGEVGAARGFMIAIWAGSIL